MTDQMKSGTESLIKMAVARAVVEVPQRILASLRKKAPDLEFKVEGVLSEDQIKRIQALSGDFRYDFVLTSYEETRAIICRAPEDKVQSQITQHLQEYGNLTVELWQGQSEASIEELRESYW